MQKSRSLFYCHLRDSSGKLGYGQLYIFAPRHGRKTTSVVVFLGLGQGQHVLLGGERSPGLWGLADGVWAAVVFPFALVRFIVLERFRCPDLTEE